MQFLWKYNRNWLLRTSAVTIGCFGYSIWYSYQQSSHYWNSIEESQLHASDVPSLKFILNYSQTMDTPRYLHQILAHLPLDSFSFSLQNQEQLSYQIGLLKIINLYYLKFPTEMQQYFSTHENFQKSLQSLCSNLELQSFPTDSKIPTETMTSTEVLQLQQKLQMQQLNRDLFIVELNQTLANFLQHSPQLHKQFLPHLNWFIQQTQFMNQPEDKLAVYHTTTTILQTMFPTCSEEKVYRKLCILLTGCEEETIRNRAFVFASAAYQKDSSALQHLPTKEQLLQTKVISDSILYPLIITMYQWMRRRKEVKQLPWTIAISSLLGMYHYWNTMIEKPKLAQLSTKNNNSAWQVFATQTMPLFLFPILYRYFFLLPFFICNEYIPRTDMNICYYPSREYLQTVSNSKQFIQQSIQIVSKKN